MDDDPDEEVTGYLYTHWDCPYCGEANESEGDVKGEEVTCDECGRKAVIEC